MSFLSRIIHGRSDRDRGAPGCDAPFAGYAVVDLETTGFSWSEGDRVIEVAVVLVDAQGAATGTWTTLVNPGRPVAGTRIHQITDRDLLHAPSFGQIAGLLAVSCAGRVLVAHNLGFDSQFLKAEMALAGYPMELGVADGLCTARMAEHYLPHVPATLEDLCYASGITVQHRHWALWDAEAAAGLLRSYMAWDWAFVRHWCRPILRGLAVEWPTPPAADTPLLPRCLPTAGHPDDDWCVPAVRPVVQRVPPLPSGRRRASALRGF